MGTFNDLNSILGLICIILRCMPIFFIIDLNLAGQVLGEKYENQAKPSQESLQKEPQQAQDR